MALVALFSNGGLYGITTTSPSCGHHPLHGRPSNEFGNRFEGQWAVDKLINVLDEPDSMRLEPSDAEGKIVEFWCGEERRSNITK
jgi:hypothetical protein